MMQTQKLVYAKITGKIDDASDGTEDGILEFAQYEGRYKLRSKITFDPHSSY